MHRRFVVSAAVHDHVRNKINIALEDLGPQQLKNIAEPIHAYRVSGTPVVAMAPTEMLAGKPSIAILPFANMSGDADQRYFSDGITEDIITELSRFTSISVVARNAAFQFRDKAPDVSRIGQQLGARYVVEGSVRRLGSQIRITAQLTDSVTNRHLWAERYDGNIEDLFTMQDSVVRNVVLSLVQRVEETEQQTGLRKPPRNWSAYDYVLRARAMMQYEAEWLGVEDQLRRAIALDSSLSEAHALLVYILVEKYNRDGIEELLQEALDQAKTAIALNPTGSGPHFAMAHICTQMRNYEVAGRYFDRAIELNPNNLQAKVGRARWLVLCGRCEEALASLDEILKTTPRTFDYLWSHRGKALFQLRRYEEAAKVIDRWIKPDRSIWAHAIAALAHSGRLDEARHQLVAMIKAYPDATIAEMLRQTPYRIDSMNDHLAEGLRMAGLQA